MKAVVFDRLGEPQDVLEVRELPRPEPGRGEVRVRMLASPVNPSDLMTIRGQYGKAPPLPATPGFEGVGIVDSVGPGLLARVRGLSPGRRVAVLNAGGGNWQELVVVPVRQAVPIPDGLSDEQAAMFFVNPATALVMTRHVLRVPRGAWLLQTAAGSSLGRMVLRLSRCDGFRVIHVVRRRETAQELRRAGADTVVCIDEESLEDRVRELTGGDGVRYALDAVGGSMGSMAIRTLAPDGRMLVYGTLSAEPLSVDPRRLMTHHLCVEGFWLSVWVAAQSPLRMLRLFRKLGRLIQDGTLASEVAASFPLTEVRTAVQQAAAPPRPGKILLRMASA